MGGQSYTDSTAGVCVGGPFSGLTHNRTGLTHETISECLITEYSFVIRRLSG